MFSWIRNKIISFKAKVVKYEIEYNRKLRDALKPCPLCGHKAAIIHWCGENKPEFWTIECGDFEDHGAWSVPIKCNFYHDEDIKHYTLEDAVKHWNEVIVPIGTAAKIAFDRMKNHEDK